jgi:glutathione peroxidase
VNRGEIKVSYICEKRNMKKILILSMIISAAAHAQTKLMKTIYDYKVKTLEGKEYDLSALKGKKVMIVNTASECGYTPQYADLEQLYKEYGSKDFVILGFPANDFGAQEPGTNKQIREFCSKNYGVTFPMMEKITVKGEGIHPLYQYLTRKELNGVMDSEVKWNFQKYLIDEEGRLVDVISTKVKPTDEKVINWITAKK